MVAPEADGSVRVRPGSHLFELWMARPSPNFSAVLRAAEALGMVDVILDQRPEAPFERDPDDHSSRVQFSARVTRELSLVSSETVRWESVSPVGIDLDAPLRQNLEPFSLEPGVYELRWTSRLRQSSRAACQGALETLGFLPTRLHALKKNLRLPGLPSASITLWYGVAEWSGPKTFVVGSDPFFFEDVRRIA